MKTHIYCYITLIILSLYMLYNGKSFSLDNEGLPASYGQSDIEEAKVPDSTKRKPQTYSGSAPAASKTGGTVTTTKPGNQPKTTQTISIGSNPEAPSAPTVGSPSSSSQGTPYEVTSQEGTPVTNKPGINPSMNQMMLQDETITQNIRTRIANDPSVSSATVIIMTQNGIVTLGGQVDTPAQKKAIEDFARSMAGVKGVNSRIMIQGITSTPYESNTYDPTLLAPPPAP